MICLERAKLERGYIDYTPPIRVQVKPDAPEVWSTVQVKVLDSKVVFSRILYSSTGEPYDLWFEDPFEAEMGL